VIGVVSNERTKAKMELYRRQLGEPVGGYFLTIRPSDGRRAVAYILSSVFHCRRASGVKAFRAEGGKVRQGFQHHLAIQHDDDFG
jgi:hypothetical protein